MGITYHQLDALFRDGAKCAMSVGNENPDVFMGFAITRDGALLFQYTKPALRGDGRYIYNALVTYLLGAVTA